MSNVFEFSNDIIDLNDYTGEDEWNAIYTVQIGELIACGLFDWKNNPLLDWSAAAYDNEQYERVCEYFNERFYYREISIEPFEEWARTLRRKLVFELMPKYKPLYERIDEGINPLSAENEYHKKRSIDSAYPETLLSGNSDYITNGTDVEYQTIREDGFLETYAKYTELYVGIDELLLDDLESMFISMYTTNINTTW